MRIPSLRSLLVALVALAATTFPALAGEIRPWNADGFAAAQAEGRPVIIHVTAPWCPTCHAQTPVVQSLVTAPEHEDLVVFDVDFDSQKDVLRQFNIRSQSTLVGFTGTIEVARTVGVTRPDALAAFFAATL